MINHQTKIVLENQKIRRSTKVGCINLLRDRLTATCDHVTPEINIALVAAITSDIPHSIVPLPSAYDLAQYTCLVHALGFTQQPRYLAVAMFRDHEVYAGRYFAEWLLNNSFLTEVQTTPAPVGTFVMYFDSDGAFTHAGLAASDGRVQSKWGTLGLFEHDVFDVPSIYGNGVRYFGKLPYEEAIELFYDFAEENGVDFQEDPT